MEDNNTNYNFMTFNDLLKQADTQADTADNIDRYNSTAITEY